MDYKTVLETLEKDISNKPAWKRLAELINVGCLDGETITDSLRTRVFLHNLLHLATFSTMTSPHGKHMPVCVTMLEYLRTKRIQTCPVVRDVKLENARYIVESSIADPYCGTGKRSFGEVAVLMFLCGEIIPKSSDYYRISQSPVKMAENPAWAKSMPSDIDKSQIRMMSNLHSAMVKQGDLVAADQLRRSMAINGASEGSVTFIEWSIRVETKNNTVVDPCTKMRVPPKNMSAHMIKMERRHVCRETAATNPALLGLPSNFLQAMLTCCPYLEFIAVIKIDKYAWCFVVSKHAMLTITGSDMDVSVLSDISLLSDVLIKQVIGEDRSMLS